MNVRARRRARFQSATMKPIPMMCGVASILLAFVLCSCETPGQTAMLGAATGAIIGNQSYTGPLRGAAIGAGAGYLIGKLAEHERRERYYDYEDGYYRRYPVARPTDRRGFVTSPYYPHYLIDVRGIPRGAKVADPSNGRIFINP
jgi:Glycine zipper